MTDVTCQPAANSAARPTHESLGRAFWLLARLYVRRGVNRFTRRNTGRTRVASADGERHWAQPFLLLIALYALMLWAVSSIVEEVLQEVALHYGSSTATGAGILLTCLALYGLLLRALLVDFDHRRATAAEEGAWFATLPVPSWVLFACRACEQGVVQPLAWSGAFPFLAGLAAFSGWDWLAPIVTTVLIAPLLLCAGILAGLRGALRARLQHLLWFRVLSWLLPVASLLAICGFLLVAVLPKLGVSPAMYGAADGAAPGSLLAQELALAADLRWLPLAEPARALLARGSVGAALGWALAYIVEVAGLVAAGAWALSRVYRAESLGAPLGLRRACISLASNRQTGEGIWRRRLGPVALRETLLLKKYPAHAPRVLFIATIASALALLAPRLGADALMSRPGNVLMNIGAILVFTLSHHMLEKERGALTLLASLPRPLSSTFAQQTFFGGLVAATLAIPAAVYSGRDLSTQNATLDVLRGLVGVAVVAVVNTALWMRSARDSQSSVWRTFLHPLIVLAAAAPIALSDPGDALGLAGQAVLVLILVWDSAAARLENGLDPRPQAREGLTLRRGVWLSLAAVFLPMIPATLVTSAGGSIETRVLVAQATVAALVITQGSRLRQAISPVCGKSLAVSVREGALWAGVAAVHAWLWLSAQDPSIILADSPTLQVFVLCMVAPVVEEVIFRGFLYRALRKHWGVVPCVVGSALAFAAAHGHDGGVVLIGLGLCTALAFERSRSLLAPILTHAVYNALVLALWG